MRNRRALIDDEKTRLHTTSVGQTLLGNGKVKVGDELEFFGAIIDNSVDQRFDTFWMFNATIRSTQSRYVGDFDAIDHGGNCVVSDMYGEVTEGMGDGGRANLWG